LAAFPQDPPAGVAESGGQEFLPVTVSGMLLTCRRDAGACDSYDLGSSDRLQDQQKAAGIVFEDTASALFGVEGLQVTGVEAAPGGGIEVWAVTDCEAAAACPECGTVSAGCTRRW
jgi:hypothetical protein